MRKLEAQSEEVDIGHIVDEDNNNNNNSSMDVVDEIPPSIFGRRLFINKERQKSHSDCSNDSSQQKQQSSSASAAVAAASYYNNSASSGNNMLPPVNFLDMHMKSNSAQLDRSSSDQSTGSLFYGKTPKSGAVLGKSSSLIFPTGVETHGGGSVGGIGGELDLSHIGALGGFGGLGGPSNNSSSMCQSNRNDPQADSKRRRINLLLDQCESVRFPFKKKLMLNNLNLAANDIPLEDLCNTSLGNSLFKLSLAGNRLGTVPARLVQSLPTLKHLDLSQCELHQLPDNWNLPKLNRLNLSHNRLTDFPEEVSICYNKMPL